MRPQEFYTRIFFRSTVIILAVLITAFPIIAQDKEKIARANVLINEAYALVGQETVDSWKAAEAKFDQSYSIFLDAVAPENKNAIIIEFTDALRVHGNAYTEQKRFATAEKLFTYVLAKSRHAGIQSQVAKALEDLGNASVMQDKAVPAAEYYSQALAIFVEVKNLDRSGFCARQLGLMSYQVDRFDAAIGYFEQAIKHYREANNRKMLMLSLLDLGDSYEAKGLAKDSGQYYKESLSLAIEQKDLKVEALSNAGLGLAEYMNYRPKEAIRFFTAAHVYFEKQEDKAAFARNLKLIGKAYSLVPDHKKAVEHLTRSSELFVKLGDKVGEGDALINLSNAEYNLGNLVEAKLAAEKAIAIFTETKNDQGLAMAHISLADTYSFDTKFDKALEHALIGKGIAEKINDIYTLNAAFRTIGWIYASQSRFDEAIKTMDLALANAKKSGDDHRVADTLVNIGVTYSSLGMTAKAIEIYQSALALARKTGNKFNEAICLNNIGYNYFVLKDYPKGRDYLERAIEMMRPLSMKREEGYAQHNLGMIAFELGSPALAKAKYEMALRYYLETKDRRVESFAYMSLGEVHSLEGNWDEAVKYLEKAIVLARETKYVEIEGNSLGLMMELWAKRKQPRLAILYGKQAVNLFQSVLSLNKGLQKDQQSAYLKQNEETYRTLADNLVTAGRLPEAQQVLDLLKAEEYLEFVRRDASEAADQAKLALTESEKKALDEYTRLSSQLTALGTRFQNLQDARVKTDGKLPDAEEAEFQKLKTQIEEAGVGIRAFLSRLATEFSKTVEDQATITPDSIETLRADLRRAGPDVVLVSTYLLPERYRAIVTTGRTMVDRKVEYSDRKLTEADINRKISEFRIALQNTKIDPRPLGKELYDIFIKPLEGDLKGAGAKTILWSLDGTLRYIPIAALSPDGKTYMAEHYQNVVVTLARQTNLFAKPSGDEWRALGAGVSKQHEGFLPLPSVISELNAIVKDGGTGGVLNGKKLVDEKFNLESFRNAVPQESADGKVFNVVHLATHFKLGVNDRDSALLLGDGKRLSLFEISKDESLDFKDIELLALSACETGVAAGDQTGREVESLGMLAQKKGAKAVLATLWKVADEGTSMFMSEFYRNKQANPKMNKSEAIRLTQKAMIDGKIKSTGIGGGCRAELNPGTGQKVFKCDPNAPFSHPYFWSPFVLIGNWR